MADSAPRRSHWIKLLRYSALSVLFTALTFVGLAVLIGVVNFPAGWSNFVIVTASIPLGFELNRRWVWMSPGAKWWKSPEVVPYGIMSLAALALSTFAVHQTGLAVAHWSHHSRAIAAEAASLASFGSLWVVQYLVLDKVLFRAS